MLGAPVSVPKAKTLVCLPIPALAKLITVPNLPARTHASLDYSEAAVLAGMPVVGPEARSTPNDNASGRYGSDGARATAIAQGGLHGCHAMYGRRGVQLS